MTREHFYKPIRDGSGILRVGATVRLLEPNTPDTLIAEPIYLDDTGVEVRENPWVAEDGVVNFYLDKPRRVDIGITPDGGTAETVLPDQEVGDAEVYKETLVFTVAGVVAAGAGNLRFYVDDNSTIEQVRASLGTAPEGGSLVVDVNVNGTSIFSAIAAQPTVLVGENTGVAIPDVTTDLTEGDYLTLDIDQTGTTTPGSDLVVQIRVRRT